MILYIIKRLEGYAPSSIYCQGVQLIVVGLLFSKLICVCVFFNFPQVFFFLKVNEYQKNLQIFPILFIFRTLVHLSVRFTTQTTSRNAPNKNVYFITNPFSSHSDLLLHNNLRSLPVYLLLYL